MDSLFCTQLLSDSEGNLRILKKSICSQLFFFMRESQVRIFKTILIYITSPNLASLTWLFICREKGERQTIRDQMLGWVTFLLPNNGKWHVFHCYYFTPQPSSKLQMPYIGHCTKTTVANRGHCSTGKVGDMYIICQDKTTGNIF